MATTRVEISISRMEADLEHGYSWDANPRLQLQAAYVAILAEAPSFFCLAYWNQVQPSPISFFFNSTIYLPIGNRFFYHTWSQSPMRDKAFYIHSPSFFTIDYQHVALFASVRVESTQYIY